MLSLHETLQNYKIKKNNSNTDYQDIDSNLT